MGNSYVEMWLPRLSTESLAGVAEVRGSLKDALCPAALISASSLTTWASTGRCARLMVCLRGSLRDRLPAEVPEPSLAQREPLRESGTGAPCKQMNCESVSILVTEN